jgi:hypothetical protein
MLLLLTACEARINAAPGDLPDAAVVHDATSPGADTMASLGPWGAAAAIPQAATSAAEDDVTLSSSALEMIFAIEGANGKDLYYSSRSSTTGPWTTAAPVPFNSAQSDETPRLSADDLTLYFASGRTPTKGNLDIWSVKRTALGNTSWLTPAPVTPATPINTAVLEKWFMPCGTDHYIMVQGNANNSDTDLVEGTLGGPAPAPITALNSLQAETGTFVSPDCLTIFFASARTAPVKIYTSHRLSLTSPWVDPSPVNDFPLPTGNGNQEDPWQSPDGHTFVFVSDALGTKDVYLSTR